MKAIPRASACPRNPLIRLLHLDKDCSVGNHWLSEGHICSDAPFWISASSAGCQEGGFPGFLN